MAIRSGFFQSIGGDRRYRAEFFASYFASFIGNGVFPNPSTNLQVVSDVNMNVNVSPGKGWINGYYLVNDSNFSITVSTADGVLNRIDRVVFALDFNTREMSIYLKRGTPSSNPSAPNLQRDVNVYELALADISIPAGTTSISQAMITDVRLNANLCGIVSGLINQVDTTTLFIQYQQEFNDFLESIQNALDGDVAGNLLNMINTLDNRLTVHENLRASTTQFGHVRLNDTITSTSVTDAATANSVRLAFNRAEAAFQSASEGKQGLSTALAGKGQTVSPTAPFSEFVTAINNVNTGIRSASGTNMASSVGLPFQYYSSATTRSGGYLEVSGLNFRPSRISIYRINPVLDTTYVTEYYGSLGSNQDYVLVTVNVGTTSTTTTSFAYKGNTGNAYVTNTGFRLPVSQLNFEYVWVAYE